MPVSVIREPIARIFSLLPNDQTILPSLVPWPQIEFPRISTVKIDFGDKNRILGPRFLCISNALFENYEAPMGPTEPRSAHVKYPLLQTIFNSMALINFFIFVTCIRWHVLPWKVVMPDHNLFVLAPLELS